MNKRTLSKEILGLFGVTVVVAVFFYVFLSVTANSVVQSYVIQNDLILTENQQWIAEFAIPGLSFAVAAILFVVLFLFLVGQKMAYIQEIIRGVESLREHRMEHKIPVEGNNELTDLAKSINYLAKTERELKMKEAMMKEEREGFIRAMSHDIRTPLTVILGYTDFVQNKANITEEELKAYVNLMKQKAELMKEMTDRLLSGGRTLEKIEHGKFLMEQLVSEWEMSLEEEFQIQVDFDDCREFAGTFDIQELRRIFENLASNVKKYADSKNTVAMKIMVHDACLIIVQENKVRKQARDVESSQIGLESIRKIVEQYQGFVKVEQSSEFFRITLRISL